MSNQVTFTGVNSQIGKYFQGDYNYQSYDINNKDTWTKLYQSEVVFLLLPKTNNVLDLTKEFILGSLGTNLKQIIKIGSLGPWRLIHKQIDAFLSESHVNYTSFDIAPLMNNIFTEQYDRTKGILLDYRFKNPAPYLDPVALAMAIEKSVGVPKHFNKNYACTGGTQYTIDQVKKILESKGYPVNKIQQTTNGKIHSMDNSTSDFVLMDRIAERYKTENWYPPVSTDLYDCFGVHNRALSQFIDEDKGIFTQNFDNDRNL